MWEEVESRGSLVTDRMMVPGGWLYRTVLIGQAVSMCFVPDASVTLSQSLLNETVENARAPEHSQLS